METPHRGRAARQPRRSQPSARARLQLPRRGPAATQRAKGTAGQGLTRAGCPGVSRAFGTRGLASIPAGSPAAWHQRSPTPGPMSCYHVLETPGGEQDAGEHAARATARSVLRAHAWHRLGLPSPGLSSPLHTPCFISQSKTAAAGGWRGPRVLAGHTGSPGSSSRLGTALGVRAKQPPHTPLSTRLLSLPANLKRRR